jgi:hypothetical protein
MIGKNVNTGRKSARTGTKSVCSGHGFAGYIWVNPNPPVPCLPYGTLISSGDWTDYRWDAAGVQWQLPMIYHLHADGTCGTYAENHENYQYLPAGFCTEAPQIRYNEYDYTFSITSPVDASVEYPWKYYGRYEDGTGISHDDWTPNYAQAPYDGMPLSNDVAWVRDPDVTRNTNSYIAADGNWGYKRIEHSTGETNPPPPCDPAGTVYNNQGSAWYGYIPDMGNYFQGGDNYNYEVANGDCTTHTESGTTFYSNGTFITNYNGNNYYWNGNGGYYTEGDGSGGGGGGCPESGSVTGNSRTSQIQIYVWELGFNITIGSIEEIEYNDGMCNTYWGASPWGGGAIYYPNGTVSYDYVDGDAHIVYRSNGNGYYYIDNYTAAGVLINGASGSNYTYINELETSFENGSFSYSEYADGWGSSYSYYSYSYSEYGHVLVQQWYNGDYQSFISDGNGSYFIQPAA